MKRPTRKQLEVAQTFLDLEKKNGHRPTYDELGAALGVAGSVVWNHMKNLQKIGYAEMNPDGAVVYPLRSKSAREYLLGMIKQAHSVDDLKEVLEEIVETIPW